MNARNRSITTLLLASLLLGVLALRVDAAQIQDLVRIKGAESNKLVGMGIVVGLKGTGDGGKFMPAMRPLAEVIATLIDPSVVAAELKDSKNVALVTLSATIDDTGVREGDWVDVQIATIGSCKSLEGGRLFLVPMTGPRPNAPVMAYAEGPIVVENPAFPTVGVIKRGAQLTRDVRVACMNEKGELTLVINSAVASWPVANNIAALINGVLAPDGPNIAKAVDPKNVVVQVPTFERTDPAAFISQILQTYIDPAQIASGARVVVNQRTGTIVVTGDVQISPVVIMHKDLTITTITPAIEPTAQNPQQEQKTAIVLDPEKRGGERLGMLLAAFNQLKVPAAERIAILKEIERSGKLMGKLIIE